MHYTEIKNIIFLVLKFTSYIKRVVSVRRITFNKPSGYFKTISFPKIKTPMFVLIANTIAIMNLIGLVIKFLF
jgi:hypothetical protein